MLVITVNNLAKTKIISITFCSHFAFEGVIYLTDSDQQ